MTYDYWPLFPVSILISTIAMSSGVGGAVFFAPLFIIVLKLNPAVAIGAALMTELFGFSSGLLAYARRRLIDYRLGLSLLICSVPAAIIGSLGADFFPPIVLKTIFAVGIIFIGLQLYLSFKREEKERLDTEIAQESRTHFESTLIGSDGTTYNYTVCEKSMGRLFAAVGGFFVGIISVGLAELEEYQLVARCRVPSPVAVATSIFVVVVTVLVASVGHFYHFFTAGDTQVLSQVYSLAIFTVPGVLIGGQLGPFVQARVNPDKMKTIISFLFIGIGIFMLASLGLIR